MALLKELGASPTLTVKVQGESLLSDGTAIVVFMICSDIRSGAEYAVDDVVMFLVQTALMAWALGTFIGYIFFTLIRLAANTDHGRPMLQDQTVAGFLNPGG